MLGVVAGLKMLWLKNSPALPKSSFIWSRR